MNNQKDILWSFSGKVFNAKCAKFAAIFFKAISDWIVIVSFVVVAMGKALKRTFGRVVNNNDLCPERVNIETAITFLVWFLT